MTTKEDVTNIQDENLEEQGLELAVFDVLDDIEARKIALECAVEVTKDSSFGQTTLETAREFYNFLTELIYE